MSPVANGGGYGQKGVLYKALQLAQQAQSNFLTMKQSVENISRVSFPSKKKNTEKRKERGFAFYLKIFFIPFGE